MTDMTDSTRVERIREALEQALQPEQLQISDDSHQHLGHPGARDGRGHFSVAIVAEAFAGKNLLERHRLVYAAVGELMETDIHALAIQARAPGETS